MDMNDTREDGKWGAEIAVDGRKPDWLHEDGATEWLVNWRNAGWLTHPEKASHWSGITAIRLPADHPHYKQAPGIDWTAPIEAVHEDGRVLSVELTTWEDERGLHHGPDKQGDYYTTWPDGDCGIWRVDGRSWVCMKEGWRIRNVAQPTRTADEQLTHYAERCKALVEKVAERSPQFFIYNGDADVLNGWIEEARAIVASMVEVDPDEAEARDLAAKYASVTVSADSKLHSTFETAGPLREYITRETTEAERMIGCVYRGIRRGRALERGED